MTFSRVRITPHHLLLAGVASVVVAVLIAPISPRTVRALPEYARRTNEPCATCHVSPGGGGPRTMRGLLWIADGRPDTVRAFKGILLAPGVSDPQVLYDVACAACHGSKGEGASVTGLLGFDFSESLVRRRVVQGAPQFGMPSFEGQFTDPQLTALAKFVADVSGGRIVPPESYPLPPGKLNRGTGDSQPATAIASGGN